MTKEEFQECFAILESEYGKPYGEYYEELKEIWYQTFENYKKEEFKKAITHYLERTKKFPLIPYIKENAEYFKKCRTEKSYREALCIANGIDVKYQDIM